MRSAISGHPRLATVADRSVRGACGTGLTGRVEHEPALFALASRHQGSPLNTPLAIVGKRITAIVPCRNEARSIGELISELRRIGVSEVVVSVDPASSDLTADVAREAGAVVVLSPVSGYDGPVLAGLGAVGPGASHVLFLDGGGKYVMDSVGELLRSAPPDQPITYGVRDRNLLWHQRLGNLLFSCAVKLRFGGRWVSDVSSVRLIRQDVISRLALEDRQFSLPFQTTVHALKQGIPISYYPIRCTQTRIGTSKVSGSYRNSAKAALQMLLSIVKAPDFPAR